MPELKSVKEDADYRVTVNFALPDGMMVSKPQVSVTGVETSHSKFTMRRMAGAKYGSMVVYGAPKYGRRLCSYKNNIDNNPVIRIMLLITISDKLNRGNSYLYFLVSNAL